MARTDHQEGHMAVAVLALIVVLVVWHGFIIVRNQPYCQPPYLCRCH